jgi:hypothetical protein
MRQLTYDLTAFHTLRNEVTNNICGSEGPDGAERLPGSPGEGDDFFGGLPLLRLFGVWGGRGDVVGSSASPFALAWALKLYLSYFGGNSGTL